MKTIERLDIFHNEYLKEKKIGGRNKLESILGVSEGYLTSSINGKKSIGSDIVEKLFNEFPELNLEWLIAGKGDMLKPSINIHGDNRGIIENTGTAQAGDGNKQYNVHAAGQKIIKDGETEIICEPLTETDVRLVGLEAENRHLKELVRMLELDKAELSTLNASLMEVVKNITSK